MLDVAAEIERALEDLGLHDGYISEAFDRGVDRLERLIESLRS